MKKRITAILMLLICLLDFQQSKAFEGDEHDKYMFEVLFGKGFTVSSVEEGSKEGKALKALSCASYLAIDQYNEKKNSEGKGAKSLAFLRSYGVQDIPKSIDEIDFPGNQYHRRYTHKGWKGQYNNDDKPYQDDQAKWPVRKSILTNTVRKVFNFGDADKKTYDSLSALIYYVHIIGDHMDETDYKKMNTDLIALGGRNDQYDIIHQLVKCFEVLSAHGGKNKFYSLNARMKELNSKIHDLMYDGGGVDSEEKQRIHSGYAKELMDLLVKSNHAILMEEPHFRRFVEGIK